MSTRAKVAWIVASTAIIAAAVLTTAAHIRPAGAADSAAKAPEAASQPASSSKPADAKGRTEPAGLPLEARLILKKDKYTLAPDKSGEAYARMLKVARGVGARPPVPPAVDMTFELTNTGKGALTVPLDSDLAGLELKLEGPGAVTIPYSQVRTMEFRMGKPAKIEPGKSITIPIAKLLFGVRGDSDAAYWTAPGTYTLTASYITTISGLEAEPFKVKNDQPVIIFAVPVKVEVVLEGGATTKP
ncbi:MAG: hypothetical protein ACE15C_15855 [Phycisphaerae bacterium]